MSFTLPSIFIFAVLSTLSFFPFAWIENILIGCIFTNSFLEFHLRIFPFSNIVSRHSLMSFEVEVPDVML